MAKKKNGLQSVGRALDVLEAMAAAPGEMGVRELAEALDMKVTTTWDVIDTLVARGYLSKDEATGRCRIGPQCLALIGAATRSISLPDFALPRMRAMCAELGESTSLALWRNDRIFWGIERAGSRTVVARPENVAEIIAYGSACGCAILAALSEATADAYLKTHPVSEQHRRFFETEEALRAELDLVRRRGFAEIKRPSQDDASAVGSAIFDHSGGVVGAIGSAVPNSRFSGAHREEVIEAVVQAAREISSQLGYRKEAKIC